jgi:hypothetical protein
LRSLAGSLEDIRRNGAKRAAHLKKTAQANGQTGKKQEFIGVAYRQVLDIRKWQQFQANVIYQRTREDRAHANLCSYDKNPPELRLTVKAMLAKEFTLLSESNLDQLPNSG